MNEDMKRFYLIATLLDPNTKVVVRLFIGTQKQVSGPPLCPLRLTKRRTPVRAV